MASVGYCIVFSMLQSHFHLSFDYQWQRGHRRNELGFLQSHRKTESHRNAHGLMHIIIINWNHVYIIYRAAAECSVVGRVEHSSTTCCPTRFTLWFGVAIHLIILRPLQTPGFPYIYFVFALHRGSRILGTSSGRGSSGVGGDGRGCEE